jgi:BolA protein
MIAEARRERIIEQLARDFNPVYLEVVDESHFHRGHAGAKSGKSHFRVIIASEQLNQYPLLQAHRLIYQSLGEMMTADIHALAIEVRAVE